MYTLAYDLTYDLIYTLAYYGMKPADDLTGGIFHLHTVSLSLTSIAWHRRFAVSEH